MSTIREVAKEAGVSMATVSRAFTAPRLTSTLTHKRVLEAAKRLNYSPVRQHATRSSAPAFVRPAITAASGAHNTIGFQFFAAGPNDPISANGFYGPVLLGAEKEATALKLHLLLNSIDRHAFAQDIPVMVRERLIGGMLLVGTTEPSVLSSIAEYVPNLVLVDNRDETGAYDCIASDGFDGAYQATKFLIDLGHRDRVLFLLPETVGVAFRDRLRGFACALFESGITIGPKNVFRSNEDLETEEERKARLGLLLRSEERPTAIVCANDYYANLAMSVCYDIGIRIPDDLSIIGYDDIEHSRHASPPLTTVRVDKELMGRLAVRHLYSQMYPEAALPESPKLARNGIPVELVVRESCRAL